MNADGVDFSSAILIRMDGSNEFHGSDEFHGHGVDLLGCVLSLSSLSAESLPIQFFASI